MVNGITVDELSARFPRLFHMAELGSWPSIRERGLLSTSGLLDLFGVKGDERYRLESCHRPESVPIFHELYDRAVIRDQKPMSDASLTKALAGRMEPEQWYRTLNSRVFFWLREQRLNGLLSARAYRDKLHDVLIVDTKELVKRHEPRIMLSPLNSGCTIPFPHKRGPETFQRLPDYPYASRKHLADPIVELAVDHGVRDIRDFVMEVWETGAQQGPRVIWKR